MSIEARTALKIGLWFAPFAALLVWHDWKAAATAGGVIVVMGVWAWIIDRLIG